MPPGIHTQWCITYRQFFAYQTNYPPSAHAHTHSHITAYWPNVGLERSRRQIVKQSRFVCSIRPLLCAIEWRRLGSESDQITIEVVEGLAVMVAWSVVRLSGEWSSPISSRFARRLLPAMFLGCQIIFTQWPRLGKALIKCLSPSTRYVHSPCARKSSHPFIVRTTGRRFLERGHQTVCCILTLVPFFFLSVCVAYGICRWLAKSAHRHNGQRYVTWWHTLNICSAHMLRYIYSFVCICTVS